MREEVTKEVYRVVQELHKMLKPVVVIMMVLD